MEKEIRHIVGRVDRIGDRRDTYRQRLRKHRLTPPLLLMLRLLESHPGLTMVELARLLGVSVPTMQSRMQRLEDLSLISRKRSRDDRRKVPTELTRRGRAMLRRVPLAGAGRLMGALGLFHIINCLRSLKELGKKSFPTSENISARILIMGCFRLANVR